MSTVLIPGLVWSEDPTIYDLGCGDSSCYYIRPIGMSTNGSCRCSNNKGRNVERFLLRNLCHMKMELDNLKLEVEIDRQLRESDEN